MTGSYVYIRKHLYDEMVKRGLRPTEFVNKLLEQALYGDLEPSDSSPLAALNRRLESLEAEARSIKEKIEELEERLQRLEKATIQ